MISGTFGHGPILFLDLDGTLLDFDSGFRSRFGSDPHDLDSDSKWKLIGDTQGFFRNLQPMPGAESFVRWCSYLTRPVILTATGRSHFLRVAAEKRDSSREFFGRLPFIPCKSSVDKPAYMQSKRDVLVDDRSSVLYAWSAAGGVSVAATGDWDQVKRQIFPIFWSGVPLTVSGHVHFRDVELAHIRCTTSGESLGAEFASKFRGNPATLAFGQFLQHCPNDIAFYILQSISDFPFSGA
jgi:hypothetical protein